jgi:predicted AlkP superfamily pyrophosphatase or phosphodiesterase
MIHHTVLNTIRATQQKGDYLYPFYNGYSIAELAPSIKQFFGHKGERSSFTVNPFPAPATPNQKVVLFLIDGFGYKSFVRYHKRFSFFDALAHKGEVYPVTSVFPSTTPAALTTIHTGLTPQEHGLPEWTVYFEEFDRIIETLPFKTWEMPQADGLLRVGGSSKMLYEGSTLYSELAQHEVRSFVCIDQKYAYSAYSESVHAGSKILPFVTLENSLQEVYSLLQREKGPAYIFVYWPHIDSVAHHFGPDSDEHVASIQEFTDAVDRELLSKTYDHPEDVLCMLTADHGQVNIKADNIINLNKYPIIDENFMVSPKGNRILPTGSPHDVFLFIDPSKMREMVDFLQAELMGQAEVLFITDALEQGLFGIHAPSQKFLKRIGNVLILPYSGYHVWYEFLPNEPYRLLGIHGGLSEEEMIVPLAVSPLKSLLEVA